MQKKKTFAQYSNTVELFVELFCFIACAKTTDGYLFRLNGVLIFMKFN